jgi:hypothetical protein
MGAAPSYYTLFSLALLLVLIIAIAGIVFGQDAAQSAIITQLQGNMGEEGATAVQGLVQAAREPYAGIIASIVGGVLLRMGATAIFAELQTDLIASGRCRRRQNYRASGVATQPPLVLWLGSRTGFHANDLARGQRRAGSFEHMAGWRYATCKRSVIIG